MPDGARGHRPLGGDRPARPDRLPHPPRRRGPTATTRSTSSRTRRSTGAFAAVENARMTLEAGFTTVRDLGGRPFLAVDLRESIDEGFVPGPRIVASGPGISMTGGHGDLNHYAPQVRVTMFPEERDFRIADGVDQVRHVVRAQLKHGVDVIKVHASGGVLSRGDSPGRPSSRSRSCAAAVEEAHAAGRKVAAHAHGAQGIKNAVTAGVDSIEHGSLIDDEGIAADGRARHLARRRHLQRRLPARPGRRVQDPRGVHREGAEASASSSARTSPRREGRRQDRLRHRRGRLPPRRQRPASSPTWSSTA